MAGSGMGEASAAYQLIKLAHKEGWLEKVIDAFKKKHTILVLGSSGVGKTQFISSLTELVPSAVGRLQRTQFVKKHSIKLSAALFKFVDTPGQEEHDSRRMAEYQDALKKGIAGVINVTSYGYHEGLAGRTEVFDTSGNVKRTYLEGRLNSEIEALSEWRYMLGTAGIAHWLLTVVTKADLWWGQRESVLTHYKTGPYAVALGPARSLSPVVMEYCSRIQRFYGEGLVSGTFDDTVRIQLRAHLLAELLAAVSK